MRDLREAIQQERFAAFRTAFYAAREACQA